jgi:hypothetical protein
MRFALVAYVIICLMVGVFGMNRKLGLWAYFFASLAFSPLIGLILVFASDPRKPPVS